MTERVCHYSTTQVIMPDAEPICGAEFWDAITDNEEAVTCDVCKMLLEQFAESVE